MTMKNATTTIQQAVISYKESTLPPRRGGEWIENPEFEETGNLLGKSFAGTDKVGGDAIFDWMFNHLDSSWFTNKDKIEDCTFLIKIEILMAIRQGALLVSKQVDGEAVSAMVVTEADPPKNHGRFRPFNGMVAAWKEFRAFWTMVTKHKLPKVLTDKEHKEEIAHFEKKGRTLQRMLIQWHEEVSPQELHWYVKLVGVAPDQGGQGFGREILERVNELADQAGVACYLECAANRRGLYEKVGYRVLATKTFQDPVYPDKREPLDICLMLRRPLVTEGTN